MSWTGTTEPAVNKESLEAEGNLHLAASAYAPEKQAYSFHNHLNNTAAVWQIDWQDSRKLVLVYP